MREPETVWRIGVDEAGYGPNLGPLVVAATAWRASPDVDLAAALRDAVIDAASPGDDRLLIADSKAVYQPGGGLVALERAVFAAGGCPASWSEWVEALGADPDSATGDLPWHQEFNPSLPIDASRQAIEGAAAQLSGSLRRAGLPAPRLAARLVFPAEFNDLVDQHGTKGAALSHVSLGLARRLYDQTAAPGDEAADFTFDKHGGRNRYGALLNEHFCDGWVETLRESRPESRYRSGDRLSFHFRTKGEAELPVALASMTAKLLREIAMRALNAFWTARVPGLRPTAGYPVDAKRYRDEIAEKQAQLGVDERILWRSR